MVRTKHLPLQRNTSTRSRRIRNRDIRRIFVIHGSARKPLFSSTPPRWYCRFVSFARFRIRTRPKTPPPPKSQNPGIRPIVISRLIVKLSILRTPTQSPSIAIILRLSGMLTTRTYTLFWIRSLMRRSIPALVSPRLSRIP